MPWNQLTSKETEDGFFSDDLPHIIFKHSPRCGISSMVLRRFEASELFKNSKETYWLLHVIENRAMSNALANDFNVRHESPQVLVLYKGELVYHAAHSAIDTDQIEFALNDLK
ncbi:MAG: bacillithiol system redox-active protein YtxJ [Crocinitomicaceae bacterium]|nr:bacillithiol system redox-active protein YtxJ [Crocinitomicaceae bacterium]|tara:strand:- start:210 stop:548 length:339 start_codon:yes stop_codon:yes gene_type:complete